MSTGSKSKNNFFKQEKGKMTQNPSSIELNDILNKSGLSDINMKKQMLINKIKNNEIDPDKYMKFVEAASKGNEPDTEASEIWTKGNFNYNSYIKIGALAPPVINILNVNGNNYINQANKISNAPVIAGGGSKKGAKDMASSSKGLLNSQKGIYLL